MKAIESIMFIFSSHKNIIVEDADLSKENFKGENMAAKQQGAGSIKRDAKIWEDYLTRPKNRF